MALGRIGAEAFAVADHAQAQLLEFDNPVCNRSMRDRLGSNTIMMRLRKAFCMTVLVTAALLGSSCSLLHPQPPAGSQILKYTGVCMSGGEWYDPTKTPNPVYGSDFVYPTAQEFSYFKSKGMNIFRLCFLWETIQPKPLQTLDPMQLGYLKTSVEAATNQGLIVILDPHNYARYYGNVIGTSQVPNAYFSDFWRQMALAFKDNPNVWFGLVNEPHDIPAQQWLSAANDAIAAIRSTGATNMITVPGIAWTGAGSWFDTWYGGTPNAAFMLGVQDPDNNWVYEIHSYLDSDSSGTHVDVVSATIGVERLQKLTVWLRQNHKTAILGETAAGNTDLGHQAIENELNYMEANHDVWQGWLWWAAGSRWGTYMYSLEPNNGQDQPQMAWLTAHTQPH
jgi:endoglucanase